ncbi:MAG: hypothetical protein ACJA1C_001032 [Crocinitomicaceae bacterium]|jgi:hypothetical protein
MWYIVGVIVVFIIGKFLFDLNKDNDDLGEGKLHEKFILIVNEINDSAYGGMGSITELGKRSFNLYQEGANQIIKFSYSTGSLTIEWKFKYFQKETIHKRQFSDVRNLSIFAQQKIGEQMVSEMENVVERLIQEVNNEAY